MQAYAPTHTNKQTNNGKNHPETLKLKWKNLTKFFLEYATLCTFIGEYQLELELLCGCAKPDILP